MAMAMAMRKATFSGANVFLSRNLVPPEVFDALHDALKLNGAQVFLCCDPSRTENNDYHVISSSDHEKFADLKAKGCNLLGPQCILSCAKEHRILPKQVYTCCLAMDGVKVLASGFERDDKVQIEQQVTAMGGVLQTKPSQDVNFVVVKNVLSAKYKWALNVLKKPIVNIDWLKQCWNEHRVVPHEPYKVLPFTGLTICVTKIPADERKEIEKLVVQNGGQYSADLTKKCTHLISDSPGGDKYMVAQRWGHIHIVTRRWIDQSIVRRACLDEASYPVRVSFVPRDDSKGIRNEQRFQENSSATSQMAPPILTEDVEATLSQDLSSFSDATKFNNEKSDGLNLELEGETKLNGDVAEDSEYEDNDLYLSNCRIFLVGFSETELYRLVLMIRKGGGSRHMLLREKLTHIIVGAPSELEKKEVRSLATSGVINVVKSTWLEECHHAKKEIPVSARHLASQLLFSKESSCFTMEQSVDNNDGGKLKGFFDVSNFPTSNGSEYKKLATELSSGKKKAGEISGNDVKCNNLEGLASKYENFMYHEKQSLRSSGCTVQANSSMKDNGSNKASTTFMGKTFCFSSSFPQERRGEVIEWVIEGGGVMLDDQEKFKAHFIIENHGLLHIPDDLSHCTLVTTHWIRSCLEEACILDVGSHIIFTPLCCHIPLRGFEILRFCVSQYEEKERLLLRNLCFTLGATFTEKLTKKVTHLLCKFTNGPKYEAACKWGIEPVTADWLLECISQDKMVLLDAFRPKPVSTQDMEEGLCTVSQYPTQAAKIIGCLPSQIFSATQGPSEITKETIGLCGEESSAFGKRSSSSISNNFRDASKKVKLTETIEGDPSTVPDVADAIEDLLAQSSKIQDMKSPRKSGCGGTIFSSDHEILNQDEDNSKATFGISRHWINSTKKQEKSMNTAVHDKGSGTYDLFSETQTDSQVVVYEEDLSGRQKIIDRVRSQSINPTPDK